MVHVRINEREANPNPFINFITPLSMPGAESPYTEEDARQLLRALAAQVRPIMKSHGFTVNSFEEYEYNRVFAGRNWNAGETIELVLRRQDGTFEATPWLLGTLCHELAHIKHMNHGRDFQRLWAQLRNEVSALQAKGYFGDGYWSSGSKLANSMRVGGRGVEEFDLPEYVCGGAQARSRPKVLNRQRRSRPVAGPSNRTGAQTERKRKAGSRVTAKGKFNGHGQSLVSSISETTSTFRKQAGSKRAREERAAAAEKRLKTLQGEDSRPKREELGVFDISSESEGDDVAFVPESDDNRRRLIHETMDDGELESMRQFMREFITETTSQKQAGKGKSKASGSTPLALTSMVNDEVIQRRRESLGLDRARKLSAKPNGVPPLPDPMPKGESGSLRIPSQQPRECGTSLDSLEGDTWPCLVCTLENNLMHLACMACNTPKGEIEWKES